MTSCSFQRRRSPSRLSTRDLFRSSIRPTMGQLNLGEAVSAITRNPARTTTQSLKWNNLIGWSAPLQQSA